MSEMSLSAAAPLAVDIGSCMRKTRGGKIKTAAITKSGGIINITVFVLLALTVYAFFSFDYKDIDIVKALSGTWTNALVVFGSPRLHYNTLSGMIKALGVTFALGVLSTIFGAITAFFGALMCARNTAHPVLANVVKSFVAFIRAVPTILWVLIFTVAAGLGSVAAVIGLSFHSAGYLIKAYAESIEEVDAGTIEALKASGASFWQIVFQAIVPSSITYMTAWTFLRFEINFTNALAVGAAAGAGGIGFDLFMAGSYYFDLHELGYITYMIVAAVIILEAVATGIKARVR
ncbi:MAG TPA: ABC transporter permease subunit [Bacillota bacterium]|nr:ABC transporter permease subunit [Bacillota bacterium]